MYIHASARPSLARINGRICCIEASQAGLVVVGQTGLDAGSIRAALFA